MEDGFLKTFLDQTKGLSYTERGEHLENAQDIIDTHMESAQEGQTEVLCYFVVKNDNCFCCLNGYSKYTYFLFSLGTSWGYGGVSSFCCIYT